jgi:hypothetical protein
MYFEFCQYGWQAGLRGMSWGRHIEVKTPSFPGTKLIKKRLQSGRTNGAPPDPCPTPGCGGGKIGSLGRLIMLSEISMFHFVTTQL